MADPTFLAWAVVVAAAAWIALAAWIIGDRLFHDRRAARTADDARALARGELDARRSSWRRLSRVADGPYGGSSTIAARELVRRNEWRLVSAASKPGFARTHALRELVRGGSDRAFALMRAARAAGESDVVAATIAIAGGVDTTESNRFLLDVLVAGDIPRSRTADQLVPRVPRIVPELLALAGNQKAPVRYWAVMLLGWAPASAEVRAVGVEASADPDEQVRAAAARLLGSCCEPLVRLVLRALLADEVFFVRAHAARAIAESRAHSLAPDVAGLLADRNWWVRAAAKEALLGLGKEGLDAATVMLHSEDAFARGGATEVVLAAALRDSAEDVSTQLLEGAAG
jgi:HEAT repeat protein